MSRRLSAESANTSEGQTGSEIEHALRSCRIPDPTPAMTKWRRLRNALAEIQNQFRTTKSLTEAMERAGRIHAALISRAVHEGVLQSAGIPD